MITVTWKYTATTPDGIRTDIDELDSINYPKGTIFTRVRLISGQAETEDERKSNYRALRKKRSDW